MRRYLDCPALIARGSRCRPCAAAYRVPSSWSRAVKARAGWRCEGCGGVATVAHHIRQRRHGGGHTTANGAALCADCHALAHGDEG